MPGNRPTGAKILVVEDERSISEPFADALSRAGFEPLVTDTAEGALRQAASFDPDLVMLDLALPDGDGRDVCRELRRRSDVPIVMLTARGTEMDKIVGLELGADDYVVKPFSAAEVISRIRAVLRRSDRVDGDAPEEPIEIGDLELDPGARRATLGGADLGLSRKEFDLLAELMRHAGQVVTREDLMAKVWDVNWFGSTKTLDVHIGWLRRKLGDDPAAPTYIETVRGVGFRFARRIGGAVSLRATLLLALAYVLLLALIALGVPLAVSLGDRVDAEVRGQARSQADVVAATSSELLGPARRPALLNLVEISGESVRGRVIVVDARGRLIADSAGAPTGRSYADRPEVRAALEGQGTRSPATAGPSAPKSSPPPSRSSSMASRRGAVRITQSVAAVHEAVQGTRSSTSPLSAGSCSSSAWSPVR